MDYQQIAVAFHLIGFALGLGGATISDVMFFRMIRRKNMSAADFQFFHTLSKIIWVGLGILILSGLIIFALIYAEQHGLPLLRSPRWQAKLTLVGVLILNGLFFRHSIFPALKQLVGQTLHSGNIGNMVGKLALSGTISVLSWYSILVISLLPRTFRPALYYFFGTYLILLAIGLLLSRAMLQKSINHKSYAAANQI